MEHEQGHHQRQRHRHEADQSGPPLEKEGNQDDHYKQRTNNKRPCEVFDRHVDEGRWTENVRVDLNTREGRAQLIERSFQAVSCLESVGSGELVDNEQQARLVVHDGVANQRLMVF